MVGYTNHEMSNMHFVYCMTDWNASEAHKLYRNWFPIRRTPDRKTFERLHLQLCKMRSFSVAKQDAGRERSVRMQKHPQYILRRGEDQLGCSTRAFSRAVDVFHMTVFRVLQKERIHPIIHISYKRCHRGLSATSRFHMLAPSECSATRFLSTSSI